MADKAVSQAHFSKLIEILKTKFAKKTEIPTKLSQLTDDIDVSSSNSGISVSVVITTENTYYDTTLSRWVSKIPVNGLTDSAMPIWEVVRSNSVLSYDESKIASCITDVIPSTNQLLIVYRQSNKDSREYVPDKNYTIRIYSMSKKVVQVGEELTKLMAYGAITEQKVVSELPADAADHKSTIYWVI